MFIRENSQYQRHGGKKELETFDIYVLIGIFGMEGWWVVLGGEIRKVQRYMIRKSHNNYK